MNPLKLLKDVMPALTAVLDSIHAHLELIFEEDKKINKNIETTNQKLDKIIDQLSASHSSPSDNDKKE